MVLISASFEYVLLAEDADGEDATFFLYDCRCPLFITASSSGEISLADKSFQTSHDLHGPVIVEIRTCIFLQYKSFAECFSFFHSTLLEGIRAPWLLCVLRRETYY